MPKRPPNIGHHLIWTLYGHWLANDPQGSGSEAVRDPKFQPLGDAHFGRKAPHELPGRGKLRAFYREATPLLEFQPFWIDEAKRQAIAKVFVEVIIQRQYTVWACAILSNHIHLVIRRHRDDALAMWNKFAEASREALRSFHLDPNHPVWAARPYKVFLRTTSEVKSRISYVERNPEKEGLAPQEFKFVQPYNNWPFHTTAM
jgi:REP element-mobilizing transposase RayT